MPNTPDAKLVLTAENRTQAAFNAVKRSIGEVERQSLSLRNALGALGVGLSVGGLAAFVKSPIDSPA